MRPTAQSPEESTLRDRCQTPAYALTPLVADGWLRFDLRKPGTVWDPAAGEGILARAIESLGRTVVQTDILTGQNFLTTDPPPNCDGIVTNPPYSLAHKFLARCYDLALPFALLMPITIIGNQRDSKLMSAFGVRILAIRQRVNFKMPNLGWSGKGAHFSTAWFCWDPALLDLTPDIANMHATLAWFDVSEANGLEELLWPAP